MFLFMLEREENGAYLKCKSQNYSLTMLVKYVLKFKAHNLPHIDFDTNYFIHSVTKFLKKPKTKKKRKELVCNENKYKCYQIYINI